MTPDVEGKTANQNQPNCLFLLFSKLITMKRYLLDVKMHTTEPTCFPFTVWEHIAPQESMNIFKYVKVKMLPLAL